MNSASQSTSRDQLADTGDDIAGEVRRLADASRRRAVGAWFPLTLGSTATLASLAVDTLGGYPADRLYWAIAGPCIAAACATYYTFRRVHPPDRSSLLAVVWAFVLLVAMLGVVRAAVPSEVDYVPAFFVAALLVGLGLIYRHWITALSGVGMLVVAVAVAAATPDRPYTWTALCGGVIGMIAAMGSTIVAER